MTAPMTALQLNAHRTALGMIAGILATPQIDPIQMVTAELHDTPEANRLYVAAWTAVSAATIAAGVLQAIADDDGFDIDGYLAKVAELREFDNAPDAV
jgi:hypothetical protein